MNFVILFGSFCQITFCLPMVCNVQLLTLRYQLSLEIEQLIKSVTNCIERIQMRLILLVFHHKVIFVLKSYLVIISHTMNDIGLDVTKVDSYFCKVFNCMSIYC